MTAPAATAPAGTSTSGAGAEVNVVNPVDNSLGTTVDRGVPREPEVVDNKGVDPDAPNQPRGRRTAAEVEAHGEDPAGEADTEPPAKAGPWKVDDLPPGAQKLIADLRKEAGDHRVAAKANEAKVGEATKKLDGFLENMAKVLGLTPDDPTAEAAPPDPNKLTAQLKAAQTEHREALVRLAVFEAAAEHGANPRALTDSVKFLQKVHKLDPSADEFGDKISAAVSEAVSENPLFRVARPAPAPTAAPSGGQFAGGPGRTTDPESLSIDDYRAALKKRRPA